MSLEYSVFLSQVAFKAAHQTQDGRHEEMSDSAIFEPLRSRLQLMELTMDHLKLLRLERLSILYESTYQRKFVSSHEL
ncbi:hypothetical protein RIF29_08229 [Crotalaria pallida]|uniref:Uncharacterized protein n=1 Tax=Crotalaria pallida TaxID=3830 RepID=A0AAN9J5C6_CROPI